MTLATLQPQPDSLDDARVVTTALLRAAQRVGVSREQLARVVGVSPATLSRAAQGKATIHPAKKEGELSLLFLRLYRSLMSLVGDDAQKAQQWLRSENTYLGGPPNQLITRIEGLGRVIEYLDGLRAKN